MDRQRYDLEMTQYRHQVSQALEDASTMEGHSAIDPRVEAESGTRDYSDYAEMSQEESNNPETDAKPPSVHHTKENEDEPRNTTGFSNISSVTLPVASGTTGFQHSSSESRTRSPNAIFETCSSTSYDANEFEFEPLPLQGE